jgi:hypothetical protein
MTSDGWASVADVCALLDIDRTTLLRAVEHNDKSRLQLDGDRIRAGQGHSRAGMPVTLDALEQSWHKVEPDHLLWHRARAWTPYPCASGTGGGQSRGQAVGGRPAARNQPRETEARQGGGVPGTQRSVARATRPGELHQPGRECLQGGALRRWRASGARCWATRSTGSAGLAVRLGMTVELSMIDTVELVLPVIAVNKE